MSAPELRALIVDDEAPARKVLEQLLALHPNVKVIAEANSVANAADLCRDLHPNLVFLDVQLKNESGFDLLPKLKPVPAVIFVTAHAEFASRAFEVNAVDYLLKPINPHRLSSALERIHHRPSPAFTKKLIDSDQIYIESSSLLRMVYLTEISGIEAQENYTMVRLNDGESALVRRSMSEWEDGLPKQYFVRTHRSLIVNVKEITKVSKHSRGEMSIEIRGFPQAVHLGWRATGRLRRALRQPNLL